MRFDDVEVEGRRTSVLVDGDRVAAVGNTDVDDQVDPGRLVEVVDGRGGALLPGLHDHHVHLAATAALARSVVVGPPEVRTVEAFAEALKAADRRTPPGAWIRAVGYHASVAGDLDRAALDRFAPDRPVRVQDASGARWTVNSRGAELLGLDTGPTPDGVERGTDGRATGRLHRLDSWLRDRLAGDRQRRGSEQLQSEGPVPFAELGQRLAAYGVTGVTDTTPSAKAGDLDLLAAAVGSGAIHQQVVVTGGVELVDEPVPAGLGTGPVKVVVDDGAYPSLDELAEQVAVAHRAHRPVAFHCVTRTSLTLVLAALDVAGARKGDRLEHGSVIAPEHVEPIRRQGLTVVTQPSFVRERGDRYLADVDPDDVPHLYRCRSLLDAGIPVAFGSDAPHGDLDPWRSIATAIDRRTRSGRTLGPDERLTPDRALIAFLGHPHDPGGPRRRVVPGVPADLCLLHVPLAAALAEPTAEHVRATVVAGRHAFSNPPPSRP